MFVGGCRWGGEAPDGGFWSSSRPIHFAPAQIASGTYCTRGFMGHRIGLDVLEKKLLMICWESNIESSTP
jgi:hypothetical protein